MKISNSASSANKFTKLLKFISYSVYIILQCTWGIVQTLAGFVYFLISVRYPHEFYHGAILTRRKGIGGVSLGLFIFANDNNRNNFSDKTAAHEFGHTIQSLLLGPLYMIFIVPESMLWCGLPFFQKLRKDNNISYYSFYTEAWANKLAKKFLHEEVTE